MAESVIKLMGNKCNNALQGRVAEKRVLGKWPDEAREWLATHGCDSRYGARPMSRLVHEKIKQPLANEILFGKLADGGSARVEVSEENLVLNF